LPFKVFPTKTNKREKNKDGEMSVIESMRITNNLALYTHRPAM